MWGALLATSLAGYLHQLTAIPDPMSRPARVTARIGIREGKAMIATLQHRLTCPAASSATLASSSCACARSPAARRVERGRSREGRVGVDGPRSGLRQVSPYPRPGAALCSDSFHVVKLATDALDTVRHWKSARPICKKVLTAIASAAIKRRPGATLVGSSRRAADREPRFAGRRVDRCPTPVPRRQSTSLLCAPWRSRGASSSRSSPSSPAQA
jgi:hypothetical protein